MVCRNSNFAKMKASYLFVEIANRRKVFMASNPDAKVISLGIGDTTEPIPDPIIQGFLHKADDLAKAESYTGYPDYNGSTELRKLIVSTFYNGLGITDDEIFISDGSKPDLARLQLLFGQDTKVAVQDPVYPVYVDGSVITGKSGEFVEEEGRYSNISYMSCNPENGFFPDLSKLGKVDVIYFCSPNNPTGAAATYQQLEELLEFAKKNNSIIVFDSAYSAFITDENIPSTIYQIPGAKDVAFETSSFSKLVGFTGVRLGWTVCPKSLKFDDQTPVWNDWSRIMGTCFNGPSNLAEAGGIATLSPKGLTAMRETVAFYLENATIIKSALEMLGFECHGGKNSPYIWIRVPGRDSWEVFQEILEKAHVVTTPGVGFGKEGGNFIRISAFAHRADVHEAVARLTKALAK